VAERPVALPPATRGNAMSTVDEYHKSARDCLRWAAKARTEEQRKQLLSLAEEWREAALLIENTSVPSKLSKPWTTAATGLFDRVNPRESADHAGNWLLARFGQFHPLLRDPKPCFLVPRAEWSLRLLAGFIRSVPVFFCWRAPSVVRPRSAPSWVAKW